MIPRSRGVKVRIVCLAMVLGCAAFAPAAGDTVLSDWRLASASPSSRLLADLDGNGTGDEAVLLTDGQQVKLLAFLDTQYELRVLDLLTTRCEPASCAIRLIPPGEYRISCGESFFECRSGDQAVLRTNRPSLAFRAADSEIVFLFENETIRKIWLTREP
jgi:hypothetical protein